MKFKNKIRYTTEMCNFQVFSSAKQKKLFELETINQNIKISNKNHKTEHKKINITLSKKTITFARFDFKTKSLLSIMESKFV